MTRTVLLGDVIQLNPAIKLPWGSEVKFISMDKLDPFNRKIAGYELRKFTGGSKFQNEDVLFARITPCLENGKTAFVDNLDDGEVAGGSTEFIILRAKSGITDPRFVYYLSTSERFRSYAIQSMVGTSGRQRVQNDSIMKYEFNLPELEEQEEISKTLSSLDEKIELNRRMNETLEQMGQTLFKHYFIDNPEAEEWEQKSLDDIAEFLNGLAMQKYPEVPGEPTLPVIKIREMSSGVTPNTDIASANVPEKYIVRNGDLLFSWSGTLIVKFWPEGEGALNQHLFKVASSNYPEWLYYYWLQYHLAGFVETAKAKATTMGHIQRHHLSAAKVLIPGDQELETLGRVFEPSLAQFKINLQEIQSLTQLRNTLLPRLMTGKIDFIA